MYSGKLKSKGLAVIEKTNYVVLRLEREKDNIFANQATFSMKREKSEDCISLLNAIIHLKTKEVVKSKIL